MGCGASFQTDAAETIRHDMLIVGGPDSGRSTLLFQLKEIVKANGGGDGGGVQGWRYEEMEKDEITKYIYHSLTRLMARAEIVLAAADQDSTGTAAVADSKSDAILEDSMNWLMMVDRDNSDDWDSWNHAELIGLDPNSNKNAADITLRIMTDVLTVALAAPGILPKDMIPIIAAYRVISYCDMAEYVVCLLSPPSPPVSSLIMLLYASEPAV